MNFFDGLIVPDAPDEPQSVMHRLGPYHQAEDESLPPADWFVPARVPQVTEAGAGPDVRIMLTGWGGMARIGHLTSGDLPADLP
ncbi:hypothetical protein ABZ876_08905 [Streptomyces sp. NPDC046931]|uniref:hypothetical protein n=1 Tax=Streptomyces sp. NPDC046931 TaxID=3154806 RepID=UPI0033EB880F